MSPILLIFGIGVVVTIAVGLAVGSIGLIDSDNQSD